MGITEALTIVFIVLKLLGKIGWSWWLVCLPEIIGCGLYILIWIGAARQAHRTFRQVNRSFRKMDERW